MSAKLRDAARADDLFRILEKYAPQLAGSLMEAWRDGVLHVVLDDLADLISKGLIDEALTLVMWGADRVFAAKAAAPLQEAFTAVAAHVWTRDLPPIPKVSRIRVVFDALNPNTVDAAKRNQLEMVQEVTTETRDGLKAYIEDALKRGLGSKQIARNIKAKSGFGLTSGQETAAQNYRAFLSDIHNTKAVKQMGLGLKRSLEVDARGVNVDGIHQWRLRDLRYDRSIKRAVEDNKPLTAKQIDEQVLAYRRRSLILRSRTIAQHEMMKAMSQGSEASWRQLVEQGLYQPGELTRYWFVTPSEARVCPKCRPMPRLNAKGRGLDEPFIDGNGNPVHSAPLHVKCRCVVYVRVRKGR